MTDYQRPREFSKESMFDVMRRVTNAAAEWMRNAASSSGGLTIGSSSKPKVKVANTVNYRRLGVVRSGLTTAEVVVPAGASMPDDGTVRSVRVYITISSSDAFAARAGSVYNNGATPPYHAVPSGEVLVGHVLIVAAAGTAYTAGSTNLDAAGLTVTYSDEQSPSWMLDRVLRNGSPL